MPMLRSLSHPILGSIPERIYDWILLGLVTLIFMTLCAEIDIFVPAFPHMVTYFGIEENHIQTTITFNLVLLALVGLIAGPLSDVYGRRKILLGGLVALFLATGGIWLVDDYTSFLLLRGIQGVAAAFPMVIGGAVFYDRFSHEKAARLIGLSNGFISAFMMGAPLLGTYLTLEYGWRSTFSFLFLMVGACTFLVLFFLRADVQESSQQRIFLGAIYTDFKSMFRSFLFWTYFLLASSSFICLTVYAANASVLFVNHLSLSLEEFGYFQAVTIVTFISASIMSHQIIKHFGSHVCMNIGVGLLMLGSLLMILTMLYFTLSPFAICLSMSLLAMGSAMITGIFSARAVELFSHCRGSAIAVMAALRQVLAALFITLTEFTFDETILPVGSVVLGYLLMCGGCYAWQLYKDNLMEEKAHGVS